MSLGKVQVLFQVRQFQEQIRRFIVKIEDISNNDSQIKEFLFFHTYIMIKLELWNGIIKYLKVNNYYGMKEKNSLDSNIGDIKVIDRSSFKSEVEADMKNGDGNIDELKDIKSIIFYNAWNEQIILEVLAENIEVVDEL